MTIDPNELKIIITSSPECKSKYWVVNKAGDAELGNWLIAEFRWEDDAKEYVELRKRAAPVIDDAGRKKKSILDYLPGAGAEAVQEDMAAYRASLSTPKDDTLAAALRGLLAALPNLNSPNLRYHSAKMKIIAGHEALAAHDAGTAGESQ